MILLTYIIFSIIMAIRETSDDVYDPDFEGWKFSHRFAVNMVTWPFDCVALWNKWRE